MKAKGFSKAFLYHLHWKGKLKKYIDGQGDFDVAKISPESCRFGKWLCSDEIKQYVSPFEIQELVSLHTELHAIAKRVYDLKMLGQDNAARQELSKIDIYSMKLSSLLTTLKTISKN
jgi:Chemoreceptor zinc-binding domain